MVHLVILFDATSLDAKQSPLVLSEELAVRDDPRFRRSSAGPVSVVVSTTDRRQGRAGPRWEWRLGMNITLRTPNRMLQLTLECWCLMGR
jgi:hypothetical protein